MILANAPCPAVLVQVHHHVPLTQHKHIAAKTPSTTCMQPKLSAASTLALSAYQNAHTKMHTENRSAVERYSTAALKVWVHCRRRASATHGQVTQKVTAAPVADQPLEAAAELPHSTGSVNSKRGVPLRQACWSVINQLLPPTRPAQLFKDPTNHKPRDPTNHKPQNNQQRPITTTKQATHSKQTSQAEPTSKVQPKLQLSWLAGSAPPKVLGCFLGVVRNAGSTN